MTPERRPIEHVLVAACCLLAAVLIIGFVGYWRTADRRCDARGGVLVTGVGRLECVHPAGGR